MINKTVYANIRLIRNLFFHLRSSTSYLCFLSSIISFTRILLWEIIQYGSIDNHISQRVRLLSSLEFVLSGCNEKRDNIRSLLCDLFFILTEHLFDHFLAIVIEVITFYLPVWFNLICIAKSLRICRIYDITRKEEEWSDDKCRENMKRKHSEQVIFR